MRLEQGIGSQRTLNAHVRVCKHACAHTHTHTHRELQAWAAVLRLRAWPRLSENSTVTDSPPLLGEVRRGLSI